MQSSLPVPALVSFALVCLLAVVPATAEDQAKSPADRCRAEVDKLCPDSRPGTVERRECVRDNADKLPEDCRGAMRRGGQAGIQALMAACGDDIEAHCQDTRRGGGRLVRCLRGVDADKLSSACREQLDAMGARGPGKAAPGAPPKAAPNAD